MLTSDVLSCALTASMSMICARVDGVWDVFVASKEVQVSTCVADTWMSFSQQMNPEMVSEHRLHL